MGEGSHGLDEQIGVETPTISAVIAVASAVMGRDYAGEAKRTMETLGLSGHTAGQLEQLLA